MSGPAGRRRGLVRSAHLALVPLVAATPAAAWQDAVTGPPSPMRIAIPALFVLAICTVFVLFLKAFTRRATDRVVDSPVSVALPGAWLVIVLAAPVVALSSLTLITGNFEFTFVGILTVISLPLLFALIVGTGIGLLAAGRLVHPNMGVGLILATVIGAAVGAFPPLGIIAFVFVVLGIGAIAKEWGSATAQQAQPDRKPLPWEHRRR